MTVVEFLLEQISADEAAARAVTSLPPWTIAEDHKTWLIWSANHGALCMSIWEWDAKHVVRWDPVRVLAECAAKRRIIELHDESNAGDCWGDDQPWPCRTLRTLAAPFAAHPDFDASWLENK